MSALHALGGYEVHDEILNTRHHGLPHNRPRWYCVGIRKDTFPTEAGGSGFKFPSELPCPSVDHFLDDWSAPSSTVPPGQTQQIIFSSMSTKLDNGIL